MRILKAVTLLRPLLCGSIGIGVTMKTRDFAPLLLHCESKLAMAGSSAMPRRAEIWG
jgi:hypothetical protein